MYKTKEKIVFREKGVLFKEGTIVGHTLLEGKVQKYHILSDDKIIDVKPEDISSTFEFERMSGQN